MVYGQFRTLISILIVLALGGLFLWGSSRMLNTITGAAAPAPTATPRPVIEQPAAATSTASARGHRHARPTPVPTTPPTPRPSPTPSGPPKVFVTGSDSYTEPATTFHARPGGLPHIVCWVRNSVLPPGTTAVTFQWSDDRTNRFLYQFPLQVESIPYTGAQWPYVTETPGKYRCDALVNGQLIGSAHFTVTP